MNMKQNKNSKFVSILSSLAIGIAGSFLWEFICSPLFHSVFNIVFSAPAKVSSFIGSWYATKISSVSNEYLAIELRAFLFVFLLLLFMPKLKKAFHTMPFVIKSIILFCLAIDLLTDIQVSQTASRIEHNIEIVSPYITDQEYKVLKSNSYSMKTMDDYNLLYEALEDVAEQHHLQLH